MGLPTCKRSKGSVQIGRKAVKRRPEEIQKTANVLDDPVVVVEGVVQLCGFHGAPRRSPGKGAAYGKNARGGRCGKLRAQGNVRGAAPREHNFLKCFLEKISIGVK